MLGQYEESISERVIPICFFSYIFSEVIGVKSNKKRKKTGKNFWLTVKLFACFLIICAATVLKSAEIPWIQKTVQKVNGILKTEEAVAAISNPKEIKKGIAEVFKPNENKQNKESEDDSIPVFEFDYSSDAELEKYRKEIEENKKKAEEKNKQEYIEKLSFQMSADELSDNTSAEPFRIPPPSYCSYKKVGIGIKYKAPLVGVVTSRFGYRDHPIIEDASFHTGLDIAAKKGAAIVAFADGTVEAVGNNATYGNYLLINHGSGIKSFYGHNSKVTVKKGAKVKLGQKVAEVGSTGMSTGPHLHFEIRQNNIRLDPALYITPTTV